MQTDEELIGRCVQREAAAFEELYARHAAPVRQCLNRIVRDRSAVDDLLQETFLRVWTHGSQWSGRGSVIGWISRIATNLALNHIRSTRLRRQEPLTLSASQDEDSERCAPSWLVDATALGPDVLLGIAEQRERLRALVDGLPEEKREVFRMLREAEMEIREVAETLRVPEGTVKSRMHYAVKRLAQEWKSLEKQGEP